MRTERLTPQLIKVLTMMQDAVKDKNRYQIHPEKDMRLTYSERANFQKLRYFGLIAKSKTRGWWVFTDLASDFLKGVRGVPVEVYVDDNHQVGKSDDLRWFNGVDLQEKPFLLQVGDYAKEKVARLFDAPKGRYL
ncbi:hypothetical protein KC614_05095 [candidate division WWE3 bacterium]|uniref:Uncharacterized protein n=1 Tax=candidate division WWE3 bacterium TaxID=2053526 RepID=A0A955LMD1_UNCKA|nr:hypothetical protein [candidate division WWE3 bacterium]